MPRDAATPGFDCAERLTLPRPFSTLIQRFAKTCNETITKIQDFSEPTPPRSDLIFCETKRFLAGRDSAMPAPWYRRGDLGGAAAAPWAVRWTAPFFVYSSVPAVFINCTPAVQLYWPCTAEAFLSGRSESGVSKDTSRPRFDQTLKKKPNTETCRILHDAEVDRVLVAQGMTAKKSTKIYVSDGRLREKRCAKFIRSLDLGQRF